MVKRSGKTILLSAIVLALAVILLTGSLNAGFQPLKELPQINPEPRPSLTFDRIAEYFDNNDHEAIVEIFDKNDDGFVDGDTQNIWDYIERLYLLNDARKQMNRRLEKAEQTDGKDPLHVKI